ncbi:MAG TPA: Wzz/FepE/Etk N-terminal domain-containing protein, partial [Bacillota bacterium]|nr:Wzz/FepE/Etk N-terminal domain-containing protein [Bacillota bacterium]
MEPMEQKQISNDDSLDLWELWAIIRKNLRPILTVFGVVVLLTGIYTFFFATKQYKSSIKFYIQEKDSGGGFLSSLAAQQGLGGALPIGLLGGGANSDLCSDIITAPSFLRRTLKEEKLPSAWKKVEAFSKKVKVVKNPKSRSLEVSVIWKDPVVAYHLTKQLFKNYKQFVDEQINHNNSKNRFFIERQYHISERRLKTAEDRLLAYEKSNGVPIIPETTSIAISNFANLEQQRVSTEISLNDAKHRLGEASTILDKKAPQVKDSVADAVNPILTGYKTKLSELEIELAKARQSYTDEHPTVKALLREKAELERQIKAQSQSLHAPAIAGNYMSGLVEVAGLEARLSSLNKVYNEYYPK